MYDAKDLYGNLGVRTTNAETNIEPEELEVMAQVEGVAEVLPQDRKNIWLGLAAMVGIIWILNIL